VDRTGRTVPLVCVQSMARCRIAVEATRTPDFGWLLEARHPAARSHPRVAVVAGRLGPMEMPAALDSNGASRERVLREVGETMLMIESSIARTRRAIDAVRGEPEPNLQALASLNRAKRDLESIRRRLHQETYLHVDLLPLE